MGVLLSVMVLLLCVSVVFVLFAFSGDSQKGVKPDTEYMPEKYRKKDSGIVDMFEDNLCQSVILKDPVSVAIEKLDYLRRVDVLNPNEYGLLYVLFKSYGKENYLDMRYRRGYGLRVVDLIDSEIYPWVYRAGFRYRKDIEDINYSASRMMVYIDVLYLQVNGKEDLLNMSRKHGVPFEIIYNDMTYKI